MKRFRIAAIAALFIALILTGCQGAGGNPSYTASTPGGNKPVLTQSIDTPDNAGLQTSLPDQPVGIDITVALPDGWKPVEGSVLEHQYIKNTASFMIKTENFLGNTLDEVVTEVLDLYRGQFEHLTVQGDPEDTTVNGIEAKKVTFTCEVSKMEMKYTYAYLFAGGKTYVLTFGGLTDSFDSLAAYYEAIINGIEVKER